MRLARGGFLRGSRRLAPIDKERPPIGPNDASALKNTARGFLACKTCVKILSQSRQTDRPKLLTSPIVCRWVLSDDHFHWRAAVLPYLQAQDGSGSNLSRRAGL